MTKFDFDSLSKSMDEIIDIANGISEKDYAQKHKEEMENFIIEVFEDLYNCSDYDLSHIYLKRKKSKVTENTVKKAINAFAKGISIDDVIVFLDKTLIKSDEGMIVTYDKIYYKNDNKKEHGVINIMDLEFTLAEWKFFGSSTFLIRDIHGNRYNLGDVCPLKKPLDRLEKCIDKIIDKVKKIRNE